MIEAFLSFLSGNGFMPHGHCYLWTKQLIELHVISDGFIALAYFSIPLTLGWFVRRRRDIDFGWMFILFGIFILACGMTHFMEVWNIWHSNYWLSGSIKALTAITSVPTAILLTRLMPQALLVPSPKQLQVINRTLEDEVQTRRTAEEKLRELNVELESRVASRTADLEAANAELRRLLEEQRRTEEALAQLAIIVQSSGDAIISKDIDGKITSWNPGAERTFGYSAQEAIGQSMAIIFPPEKMDEEPQILERIRLGEVIGHFETERLRKGGARLDVSVSVSPIRDISGNIIASSTIARDITESKQVEGQMRKMMTALERSNQELGQFAYVASHDLKEPLRAVTSCVQLLRKGYGDKLDGRGVEFIDHAVDGAKRMQQLIDGLLSFSRLEQQESELQLVNLSAPVQHACENLETSIAEGNVQVHAGALPTLKCHTSQMVQLFQNLIGNAVKFRRDQAPEVWIDAERKNGDWLFSVRDNGIGFEPEFNERIFGLFQRLHTRRKYSGTGIGLAICKKIVERHQGRIWAESQPNHGTTFFFTLPD
ncbi:multi-sensor signal transduction histidine kinase [Chthoniobacter flavus Ellin428]|uniref:histidine kinase n=1 Tax=Chthoniobacter flavus Ellin428 TaxID=497964 RepID=B4D4F6_9BACT|nr:ATP-binding protein [Chthoniobacter flavus]EDY18757.1 multi-sensor signal transduction histidine kinase [Chthoniobacter flavus Ellin428]TCO89003.1 PAS domain S-box-containing protein [Chthoniobacter flavus]